MLILSTVCLVVAILLATKLCHAQEDPEAELKKFLNVQNCIYQEALNDIKKGINIDRWLWFIFPQAPQMSGNVFGATTHVYTMHNAQDALEFLNYPVLRDRLLEVSNILENFKVDHVLNIMSYSNALQFKTTITLFAVASPEDNVFQNILEKYFYGEYDENILSLVEFSLEKQAKAN